MKKLFLAACAILLAACDNHATALKNVREEMGTSVCVSLPDDADTFVCRKDDGSVWMTRANGRPGPEKIWDELMLFPETK